LYCLTTMNYTYIGFHGYITHHSYCD
jgi:hypothetical protein